jgi:hypothetical protein
MNHRELWLDSGSNTGGQVTSPLNLSFIQTGGRFALNNVEFGLDEQ